MKNISTFLPYVLPYAKGCPQAVARQAVLDAAIEFCERSQVLQITLDPLGVEAGVRTCDLFLPTKYKLVQILRAWFKGSEMTPAATDNVLAPDAWRDEVPGVQSQSADPNAFYIFEDDTIGLYPLPLNTEDDVLTVRVAVKPSRTTTQLDDVLYDEWVEVIAAGALKRLQSTPGEPYTDAARAADSATAFAAGVSRAKYLANFGRTRGELAVRPRPFC